MLSFMGLSGARSGSGVVEVERFLTPKLKEPIRRNQDKSKNQIG